MDFLTVNWNKLDSLPEFIMLIGGIATIGLAIWYIFNRDKNKVTIENNEATIDSYKNALEGTRIDLQTQLDHCTSQHEESQKQINSLKEEHQKQINSLKEIISGLQGEIKTLREIPLAEMARGIESLMTINGKILDVLKKTAVINAEDRETLTTQTVNVAKQNVDKQDVKNQNIKIRSK